MSEKPENLTPFEGDGGNEAGTGGKHSSAPKHAAHTDSAPSHADPTPAHVAKHSAQSDAENASEEPVASLLSPQQGSKLPAIVDLLYPAIALFVMEILLRIGHGGAFTPLNILATA
ncbi:MAG: hypothetical protein IJH87_04315, partial [Atopobiaceae bacterium]|nr:hypothetical protein [Atopobiaceae bacterium]